MSPWVRWPIGLFWSLPFGFVFIHFLLAGIRAHISSRRQPADAPELWQVPQHIAPWAVGLIERVAFTFLASCGVPDVLTAGMAWIAIKMAADWSFHPQGDAAGRLSAALGGLMSVFFAVTGGLICRGVIF